MGDEDEYAAVTRSKLKLREDGGVKKRKKKDKKRSEEKVMRAAAASADSERPVALEPIDKRTAAERAFQRMQEKMQKERIQQKAEMTHKQRVEKFNQHLDSLTEHFDIPKVSWTK